MELTSESTALFFKEQKTKDASNDNCFDCGAIGTDWASISHGIYICLQCSGKHRSHGVQISFVRSLSLDTWNRKYIDLMAHGGNGACSVFFEHEGISKLPIQTKYVTKAAQYYRELLKAKTDHNITPPAPLTPGSGQDYFDGYEPPRQTGAAPTSSGTKENTQEPHDTPGVWSDWKTTVQEDPVFGDWARSVSGWWCSAKEYAGQQKTEESHVTEWYEDTKRSMTENFQYAKEKVSTDFSHAKTMLQENYVAPGKAKAEEYKASMMETSSSWLDTLWGPSGDSPGESEPQSEAVPEKIPDIMDETKTK